MSLSRTLASIVASILIGVLTIFIAAPRKIVKAKTRTSKASSDSAYAEDDDLFI
jgi:hypothetical protein